MWKKVIIHIGFHKTGSTSIQKACFDNADQLREFGIVYPTEFLNQHGHHELAWSAGVSHPERAGVSIEEIAKAYSNHSSESGILVLSSEEFEFLSQPGISKIKSLFPAEEYKILIYLRRPDEYLVSDYQQNVKMYVTRYKYSINHFNARFNFNQRLNYLDICWKWAGIFGKSSIYIYNYSNEKRSLLKRFFERIDPRISVDLTTRVNRSLSAVDVKACAMINKQLNLLQTEHQKLVYYLENDNNKQDSIYSLIDVDYRTELLAFSASMLNHLEKEFKIELRWSIDDVIEQAKNMKSVPEELVAQRAVLGLNYALKT